MIFFEISKHIMISMSIGVNFTLTKKLLERNHLHSVFNLGYCFYFILSAFVAPFQLVERFNLLNLMIENESTSE